MLLQVKSLHPDAHIPVYAYEHDAGMDLFSCERVEVQPGARAQIPTGIAMAIPVGYVGLIWDKSGISHKCGIKTLGGVVDAGYRGEVLVGLVNLGSEIYLIEKGAKIAQMLIQEVAHVDITVTETLDETLRGDRGFGSTGIHHTMI